MTVVTRHIGRLGNSMWQVANSIGYARKYGYQWAADESNGHGEPYSAIHKVFPNLPKQRFGGGVRYHEHPHGICPQHNVSYDLCHFDYHDIPDLGSNVSFTGFYQSWKYFEHCKEEVKEVFKLPHVEGFEDFVSIHVRRGDYVQHSGSFPPITVSYISNGMAEITDIKKQRGESTDWGCLIFSDDIQWVKDNWKEKIFIHSKDIFVEEPDEFKSLSLMASCGHHIIANSSFSWWGAYLGHNPNRIVVSPSCKIGNWFGHSSGIKKDCVDLLPESWVQIEFR